jgi:hypothetical protein
MKGKLINVDDNWFVEYTDWSYSGGSPEILGSYTKKLVTKRTPLYPDDVDIFDVLPASLKEGDKVKFKLVFLNPMGREVDPNNLGQNHSQCVWYAELLPEKTEKPKEIKFEDVFNDEN